MLKMMQDVGNKLEAKMDNLQETLTKGIQDIKLKQEEMQNTTEIKNSLGVPAVAQWLTNPTGNHEVAGSIPGLAPWVNYRRCRELWCRLQTRLGSRVAVALV